MRWIILALSLGASTMSIMHGILIILGIFNPPEVAAWSAVIPQTVLKSLPIVSAFIALIGGVVAFSGSKVGAFFLLVATVLCAFAPRDIWIYGGLYFLAMILCIFIKKRQYNQDYYDYDFEAVCKFRVKFRNGTECYKLPSAETGHFSCGKILFAVIKVQVWFIVRYLRIKAGKSCVIVEVVVSNFIRVRISNVFSF